MYGLVNMAVEEFVQRRYGEDLWHEVVEVVCPDLSGFAMMEPYPDELTTRLVGESASRAGIEPSLLMRQVGQIWVEHSAKNGFGDLIELAGSELGEFLGNLDRLHGQIGSLYTALRPPSFRVERLGDGFHELHYYSEREGLTPLVVGLIEGLAERFRVEVEVEHLPKRGERDHDVFLIREQAATGGDARGR